MIRKQILPGFDPDLSIFRAGSDGYIATFSFDRVSGDQIHHSTDLVNWRHVSRPLNRACQLDMRGNPGLCGISVQLRLLNSSEGSARPLLVA